jgi:hypothetical protein
MRLSRLAAAAAFVFAAGCSQQQEASDYSGPSSEPSLPKTQYEPTAERTAAPGVDVTAAPGVAFSYRYAFRLPSENISGVQEAHAQACEKLGLDRCRITGMRYRLVNQKDIEAMLALRLEPAVARNFGKQATEVVTKAEGMLVDLEISGEDVGSQIKAATRSETQIRADLAEVERQLAAMRANDPRRGELVARAEELRRDLRALTESKAQGEERLEGTPMVFHYGSGRVVPGFDVRSPIRDAIGRAGDNVISGLATILLILITLLPWLLLGATVYYLWQLAKRRFGLGEGGYGIGRAATPEPEAPAAARPSTRRSRKPEQG